MCVICVSESGKRQPTQNELHAMWISNPDGGGFMFVDKKTNKVQIRKGFKSFKEFYEAVKAKGFDEDDVVVYHFRIATQARQLEMTHPFPLSNNESMLKRFNVSCSIGVAHNGIIMRTSNGNKEFSDTALFIRDYLTKIIKDINDLEDSDLLKIIEYYAGGFNKIVMLSKNGTLAYTGDWIEFEDLKVSNTYFKYELKKKQEVDFYESRRNQKLC